MFILDVLTYILSSHIINSFVLLLNIRKSSQHPHHPSFPNFSYISPKIPLRPKTIQVSHMLTSLCCGKRNKPPVQVRHHNSPYAVNISLHVRVDPLPPRRQPGEGEIPPAIQVVKELADAVKGHLGMGRSRTVVERLHVVSSDGDEVVFNPFFLRCSCKFKLIILLINIKYNSPLLCNKKVYHFDFNL